MLHAPPPPWNTEARYSKHVTVAYTSLALVPCLPPPSPWQDAREAASQAKIEALMRDLEQSRAEAAEMQERLFGFEAERRKLEAISPRSRLDLA